MRHIYLFNAFISHTDLSLYHKIIYGLVVTAVCRDCVNHAINKCRIPKVYILIGQMLSLSIQVSFYKLN